MKGILGNVLNNLLCFIKKPNKEEDQGFFTKLIDDDNDFSTLNFFLIAMTFVGIMLLIVPMGGLIVDIIYNHTITINMSDLATYILAVSGIFGVAGLSNAWSEYSWNKYGANIFNGEKPECDNCHKNNNKYEKYEFEGDQIINNYNNEEGEID